MISARHQARWHNFMSHVGYGNNADLVAFYQSAFVLEWTEEHVRVSVVLPDNVELDATTTEVVGRIEKHLTEYFRRPTKFYPEVFTA